MSAGLVWLRGLGELDTVGGLPEERREEVVGGRRGGGIACRSATSLGDDKGCRRGEGRDLGEEDGGRRGGGRD